MKGPVLPMKKIIAGLCALLVLSLGVCSATAADTAPAYGSLLVLGDSITTGYGLDNYVPGGDPYNCASYGNQLAAALGLTARETYINKAVNGDTTGDLRALLPGIRSVAARSDLIVISIGGNDFLHHIFDIASAVTGAPVSGYENAIPALISADVSAYTALAQNAALLASLNASLASCGENLEFITQTLREINPTARIIFLEQYNPLAVVNSPVAAFLDAAMIEKLNAVCAFAAPFLDQINDALRRTCEKNGCETADVPSVINPDPILLTNITKMDIHPSAEGHARIFALLCEKLGIEPAAPGDETTAAPADPTEHVHTFGDWTQTENVACTTGVKIRVCTACGFVESELIAPTAPHEYADGVCVNCGAKAPEGTPTAAATEAPTAAPDTEPAAEPAGSGCRSATVSAAGAVLLAAAAALADRRRRK